VPDGTYATSPPFLVEDNVDETEEQLRVAHFTTMPDALRWIGEK